jgi:tRNA (guanine-N7-)-methyltransferase
MKPSDLKAPFAWNARKVIIDDRILYAPSRCETYDDFHLPSWSDPQLFGNANPIEIEYCSGNGTWIAAKAQANPQINWIAVEKKFVRVRKIWSKIKNFALPNLIVVCGEAYLTTRRYFPEGGFRAAYINFPDPWPKKRHAKHRLIHPAFVSEVARVLDPEGTFTLVTDDPDYSIRMIAEMNVNTAFRSHFPAPFFITDMPNYGDSFFDSLWRSQGKTIHYHQYVKQR